MRSARDPWGRDGFSGGFGGGIAGGGRPPEDLIVLIGVLFVTFVLQFFEGTAIVPAILRLGPLLYRGAVWEVVTYAFCGFGGGIWFPIQLLILYWFARDVIARLGRRRFWTLIIEVVTVSGIVAAAIRFLGSAVGLNSPLDFVIMQGQYMLLTVVVAAFATLYGRATILLFFVLPIQARWFLPLEILFAFMGYLPTKDFAGFVGLCVAVGLTWALLQPGGLQAALHNLRLRFRRRVTEIKLARLKRKRDFRVVEDKDEWIH